jgi:beta-glucoside operon transcriptional antiterminator
VLTIKKTLNSSVVLVEQNGQPMILLGKGIGYGKKEGAQIKYDDVSQVFMPVDNLYVKQMLDSIDSIPAVYFELAQEIVAYATKVTGQKLNNTVYFALTDHLHFAVERFQKEMPITNRVFWEIKTFYRSEFSVGEYALSLLKERLSLELPEQEAANVAFHIINAQSGDTTDTNGAKYAHLVGKIVNIVRYTLGRDIANDDIHYTRFITHVKYFVERFFADKMLHDNEDPLFEHLQFKYPKAMNGAFKVREYIEETYQQTISNEEVTYLAVHIYRLLAVVEADS